MNGQDHESDLRLLTVTDVSRLMGVPVATLYVWRTRGQGPAGIRLGRHLRYREQDVTAWIDEKVRRCGSGAA